MMQSEGRLAGRLRALAIVYETDRSAIYTVGYSIVRI